MSISLNLKRNLILLILLLTLCPLITGLIDAKDRKLKAHLVSTKGIIEQNERKRTELGNNSKKSTTNSTNQINNNSTSTEPKLSRKERLRAGVLDFQTKMLLVCFSIFMLIFVLMLLIIGHFTWFADIRHKLEEEWEQELKAEEAKRAAKAILAEMKNPFEAEVDKGIKESEGEGDAYRNRRVSVDSAGCTRGRCVPPHHSILCPNNPNVPSLTDPIFRRDPANPLEYDYLDQRPSSMSEWMNLDSSVKISEPVPVRENIRGFPTSFSTSSLIPKPPVTPMTPGPNEDSDPENANSTSTSTNHNRINSVDIELGKTKSPLPLSPQLKFDFSKLDMF